MRALRGDPLAAKTASARTAASRWDRHAELPAELRTGPAGAARPPASAPVAAPAPRGRCDPAGALRCSPAAARRPRGATGTAHRHRHAVPRPHPTGSRRDHHRRRATGRGQAHEHEDEATAIMRPPATGQVSATSCRQHPELAGAIEPVPAAAARRRLGDPRRYARYAARRSHRSRTGACTAGRRHARGWRRRRTGSRPWPCARARRDLRLRVLAAALVKLARGSGPAPPHAHHEDVAGHRRGYSPRLARRPRPAPHRRPATTPPRAPAPRTADARPGTGTTPGTAATTPHHGDNDAADTRGAERQRRLAPRPSRLANRWGRTPRGGPSKPTWPCVGAGAAGLYAALCAAREGARVVLVSATPLAQTASYWAQGGLAAALASDDSFELHLADTERAGRELVRRSAAEILVREAPGRVRDLQAARRALRRRPLRTARARAWRAVTRCAAWCTRAAARPGRRVVQPAVGAGGRGSACGRARGSARQGALAAGGALSRGGLRRRARDPRAPR